MSLIAFAVSTLLASQTNIAPSAESFVLLNNKSVERGGGMLLPDKTKPKLHRGGGMLLPPKKKTEK